MERPVVPGSVSGAALAALLGALPLIGALTGKHPALVDPTTATCATCHEAVLNVKVRHSPVDDSCLTCHAFTRSAAGTETKLTDGIPALCLTCHTELEAAAGGTLAASHSPVADCTTCHRPHGSAQPHLLNTPEEALCRECHANEDTARTHKVSLSRSGCVSCHAPHGSATKGMLRGKAQHAPFLDRSCEACHRKGVGTRTRLAGKGAELCYACHTALQPLFARGHVHTAVKNGSCTGCHDPHLADTPKLLRASGSPGCFACHEAVRAKASGPFAHAPVKKDCLVCHEPHRSEAPGLLKQKSTALCLTCHKASKPLETRHLGADLKSLRCTSCHDPHGSPRKGLLLSTSQHAPFTAGACDSCHAGSPKKLVERGRDLCLACHGPVGEAAAKARFPHAAMSGECLACHTPHASAQPGLVTGSGGAACLACHADVRPQPGETMHGAIGSFGCESCHEPHGGASPKLLRSPATELCLGCHDARKLTPTGGIEGSKGEVTLLGRYRVPAAQAAGIRSVVLSPDGRNHPVPGHRTLGKPTAAEIETVGENLTFTGELACVTCHNPHKGRSRYLFRGAALDPLDSCTSCHRK